LWTRNADITAEIPHTYVSEFLEAFPFIGFSRIDIPLGVNLEAVRAVELTRHTTTTTEAIQVLKRFPAQYVHLFIHPIGDVRKGLIIVTRKRDIPHGTGTECLRLQIDFFNKLTLCRKDLNPIAGTVTRVDKPVIRRVGTVHRLSKLWVAGHVRTDRAMRRSIR
jgi:hypothetical protein